jgi:MFS family permease
MLFLIKEVGTNASLLGVIVASQSVGLFSGTFIAGWTAKRFGVGLTIVGTPVLSTIAVGIIALARGPLLLVVAEILCGQFLIGFALIIYHINQMSLQQLLIADQTRGRLNATMSFIGWCVSPLGALVGGVLGTQFGLRPAMIVAALGLWLALPWLMCSPLRNVKEHAEAR